MNEVLIAALRNWRELNKQLHQFREDQVLEMLNGERAGKRRLVVLERLHQRYCALRAARERTEILAEAQTL